MAARALLRFAPSPNGFLHLGHAYSALLTWSAAEQLGGTALLRIEDIDLERCKPVFTDALFEDLGWLGLRWPEPVWRQSTRFAAYAEAAVSLRSRGLLYPCFCTRARVAAEALGRDPDGAPLYSGRCRHLPAEEAAARAGRERHQWRLHIEAAKLMAGPLEIAEMSFSGTPLTAEAVTRAAMPSIWGDAVIVRKDVPTSYHLSVVVDDAAQGITHVTRGTDLHRATDLHVLLQNLLGLPSPVYAHHPLVRDDTGDKLAKSRGSESLRDLRSAGWTAADLRRRLGFA